MSSSLQRLHTLLEETTQMSYVVFFNSTASALFALTTALELDKDDEVIATPIAPPAPSSGLYHFHRNLTWCDVGLNGNIDPVALTKSISQKSKLLFLNNFAGTPVAYDKILQTATRHELFVLNDVTHALGATFHQKPAASMSDASFIDFETFTGIKGASICTNERELALVLKSFTSNGIEKKELWNYDVATTALDFGLEPTCTQPIELNLKQFIAQRQTRAKQAETLQTRLQGHKLFMLQHFPPNSSSAHAFFPIILNPELHCPKEDIYKSLRHKGIDVEVHYKPLHKLRLFEKTDAQSLHVADDFYRSELSLPLDANVPLQEIERMAKTFLETIEEYGYRGCSF